MAYIKIQKFSASQTQTSDRMVMKYNTSIQRKWNEKHRLDPLHDQVSFMDLVHVKSQPQSTFALPTFL